MRGIWRIRIPAFLAGFLCVFKGGFECLGDESNDGVSVERESASFGECGVLFLEFTDIREKRGSSKVISRIEYGVRESNSKLNDCHRVFKDLERENSNLLKIEFLFHSLEDLLDLPSLEIRLVHLRICPVRDNSERFEKLRITFHLKE